MPIAGAHAVAGAYLHFTATRDKLPEMLFAGNMIGGAFGARARLCARGRSGGRMIAPRGGGGNTSHSYLIIVGRFRHENAFFLPLDFLFSLLYNNHNGRTTIFARKKERLLLECNMSPAVCGGISTAFLTRGVNGKMTTFSNRLGASCGIQCLSFTLSGNAIHAFINVNTTNFANARDAGYGMCLRCQPHLNVFTYLALHFRTIQ